MLLLVKFYKSKCLLASVGRSSLVRFAGQMRFFDIKRRCHDREASSSQRGVKREDKSVTEKSESAGQVAAAGSDLALAVTLYWPAQHWVYPTASCSYICCCFKI